MAWWNTAVSTIGNTLNAAKELNDAYEAIIVAEAAMQDAAQKMMAAKTQIAEAVAAIKAIKQPN